MDLSSPHGSSVNNFIPKDDYTLHYASFDEALTLVARYGQKALMAKLDIKHAFRLCPVRLEDRELLGIHWQGKFYIDLRLPFGLTILPLPLQPPSWRLWVVIEEQLSYSGLNALPWRLLHGRPSQLICLCPQRQDHPPRGLSGGHTPCPQQTWRTHHTPGVSGHPDRHHLHGNFSARW